MKAWLLLYAAASLVHFVHNAEFLDDYPNMPAWISSAMVYGTWAAQTALGVAGYLLYRSGHVRFGLGLLAVYAAYGLDGLAHYVLAPLAQHTAAMNATIWLEVAAATVLLVSVLGVARGRV